MRKFVISFVTPLLLAVPVWSQDNQTTEKEVIEPISKAEFLSEQRAKFNKADSNFDGRLTRDEMNMARFESQKEAITKRFKGLDTDFSGYLSLQEIRDWHVDSTEKRIKGFDRRRENLLKQYDLDNSGTISPYELDEVFELMAKDARIKMESAAKNDLKRKDKDDSGSVSLEEYIQSKAPRPQNQRPLKNNMKATVQDANGDSIITRTENEKFITEMFEKLDKDDNDELSAKEQNHNAFRAFENFHPNSVYLFSDDFQGAQIEFPGNQITVR